MCKGSLTVIETGTIQKLWYGFPFLFHSNYGSVFVTSKVKRDIGRKSQRFSYPLFHSTNPLGDPCQNITIPYGREQELTHRKQIARQLHTQYIENIYRPKYYSATLKSRVKDHSRSLETEPLDRSYTTMHDHTRLLSYLTLTLKCGLEVPQGHWK